MCKSNCFPQSPPQLWQKLHIRRSFEAIFHPIIFRAFKMANLIKPLWSGEAQTTILALIQNLIFRVELCSTVTVLTSFKFLDWVSWAGFMEAVIFQVFYSPVLLFCIYTNPSLRVFLWYSASVLFHTRMKNLNSYWQFPNLLKFLLTIS